VRAPRRLERRHERARRGLADPAVRQALEDEPAPIPDDALEWLAQICRLEGLPFDALVPVVAMLPPESIRFFHVDPNWLDALVDGALSIADLGGDEREMLRLLRPRLREGVEAAAPAWSGFLLRSQVVSSFPGLHATAYPAGGGEALKTLRLEPLSAGVLIGIFDGVAERIEIAKPAQILHFGVEPVGESGPPFEVHLRGIAEGAGGAKLGEEILGPDKEPLGAAVKARGPEGEGPMVLDVTATVGSLEEGLGKALGSPVTLGAATTGIQLVQGTEVAVFAHDAAAEGEGEADDGD
jgi:hypothetical protein